MDKQVSVKNTKTEILEAYESLLSKMQEGKNDSPQVLQEEQQKNETVKKASGMSYESIVKDITGLKISLSSSLDKLEDLMLEKYKQLSQLHEAIDLQEKKLDDLYRIKACADSLAALMMAQREQKEHFEREMTERRSTFDADMAGKKASWQKEQEQFEQLKKERDLQLKNEREREEEEYTYNLKTTRRKEQDAYDEQKEKQEKELEEKRLRFDQEIRERESRVAATEAELADLRTRTAKFPDELAVAVEKAEKALNLRLKQEFDHEKELTAEKINGEQRLKEQTILSLKEKIKEQEVLIRQLTEKTVTAENSVKDIALKALESSSIARVGYEKTKEVKE